MKVLLLRLGTNTVAKEIREIDQSRWPRIQSLFQVIDYDCPTVDEFHARLAAPGHIYSRISAIAWAGWLKSGPYASQHRDIFGARTVELLPPSVRLVCCGGHGYDFADVAAMARKGIAYANCPDTCTEAVANTALHLILNSFRYFSLAEHWARQGDWEGSRRVGTVAVEPDGMVLGVVGMGDIGTRIARKAAWGLGMRIHYHNRRPRPAEDLAGLLPPGGGEAVFHPTLDSLLAVADCVCVACPLTPATKHLFSRAAFGKMKEGGARIVNIARGGIVDEDALLEAMRSRRIVGVGLDVHADEPGVNPALRDDYDTTLLPHVGVCSRTSWLNFDKVMMRNLEEFFFGDKSKVTIVPVSV